MLPLIKEYTLALVEKGGAGYTLYKDGIIMGEGVKIYEGVTIEPPAFIGAGVTLRPGAYIRGSVIIGDGSVIGNSTEIKNCILTRRVQLPHYNYVGDSVIGCGAHLGAGSICSNLKSDGKTVVIHAEREVATGLRKVGSFLGDGVEVGCGCVLNPGTVIGKRTSVYPLTALRGVYEADSIIKNIDTVVKRT